MKRVEGKKKTPSRLSFPQREKKILKAAMTLFSKNGFQGTTTKAIALKAGVNEALLYRHFPTKEDLYVAILKLNLTNWTSQIKSGFEKILSFPLDQGLIRVAKIMILQSRKDPAVLRMMLYSALENRELSRLFFKQRLPIVEFLERLFQEKFRQGLIRKMDYNLLAGAFLGLIHNYILTSQLFKAKSFYSKSEDEVLSTFIQIFTRGILL